MDPVALTRALVDLDSTTGREGEVGRWLADHLRDLGFSVTIQPVDDLRFNILATVGSPQVVFSTHFDCVPPFFPSRIDGDRLYGRGSCDAKGILAAQIAAADAFRREGETRVGLLFVVGEERGSDGAKIANAAANGCRFLIDGEPTESRLGLATRGMLRLKLQRVGPRGALVVSGARRVGDRQADRRARRAAIDRAAVRSDSGPHALHGRVDFRRRGAQRRLAVGGSRSDVSNRQRRRGRSAAPCGGSNRACRSSTCWKPPPVHLATVPGYEAVVFPYTTDIPFLSAWGQPLLFGPGSIHVAHTADEFISIAELLSAVAHYGTHRPPAARTPHVTVIA